MSAAPHVPVLLDEVLALLDPPPGARILDGTLGAGGHSAALLERGAATLLGLDRDPQALEIARARLDPFRDRARVELAHASFEDAPSVAAKLGLGPFDRILVDLGVSSMQLDRPERGFTFMGDGPLDMRMDPTSGEPAAAIVNELEEEDLANLIYRLGDEPASRRIARAIVQARKAGPIGTTKRLADVVGPAAGTPRRGRKRLKIHPATRTFQALRIAVNDELGTIERGLPRLFELLAPSGRLAVIAFHSLEDRLVKRYFRELSSARVARRLTKKPIRPGEEEVARNPRARSARLRAIEKVVPGEYRKKRRET